MSGISNEQIATIATAASALIVSVWAKLSKKETVDDTQSKAIEKVRTRAAAAEDLARDAGRRAEAAEQRAAMAERGQQDAAEGYASAIESLGRRIAVLEAAAVGKEEFSELSAVVTRELKAVRSSQGRILRRLKGPET